MGHHLSYHTPQHHFFQRHPHLLKFVIYFIYVWALMIVSLVIAVLAYESTMPDEASYENTVIQYDLN